MNEVSKPQNYINTEHILFPFLLDNNNFSNYRKKIMELNLFSGFYAIFVNFLCPAKKTLLFSYYKIYG